MFIRDCFIFRVLISAVKKDHINLKLHFFNNCFNDEHCKHCKETLAPSPAS